MKSGEGMKSHAQPPFLPRTPNKKHGAGTGSFVGGSSLHIRGKMQPPRSHAWNNAIPSRVGRGRREKEYQQRNNNKRGGRKRDIMGIRVTDRRGQGQGRVLDSWSVNGKRACLTKEHRAAPSVFGERGGVRGERGPRGQLNEALHSP